ncbi:MAG TPA: histidinol-phosphate transaminase, partial [Limnochordia bacterium]|nr:histidinol-phosphate transaminase [Limnochordia bacterium]
ASELVTVMLEQNGFAPGDIVSGLFTLTDDLNAAFPAEGARRAGLSESALLCAQEVPVPGSMPRCIRAMLWADCPREQGIRHAYLREAARLRPDWTEPDPVRRVTARPALSRLTPYVPGKPIAETAREFGLDPTAIVKLASNENPLGPSPEAVQAAQAACAGVHLYPDGAAQDLLGALARRLQLDLDQLIVGNGSDELIKLLGEAYLRPGDEVVYAEPSFVEYAYACRLMDGKERPVPLLDGVHDLEAMLAAITPRTRLVFVCNPNNTTGSYVGRRSLGDFMARVPEHVIVVFDEAYVEYVGAGDFPETLAWVKAGRNAVVLRTFSKIYGLAGLRVGYGAAPPGIIADLRRVKEPFNVNLVAQAAALAALADEAHLVRSRQTNDAGKVQLAKGLAALGMRVWPSEANFLWVDTGRDGRALYERLLKAGVIVRTGDVFGSPSFLRITIGRPEQNEKLLAEMGKIVAVERA